MSEELGLERTRAFEVAEGGSALPDLTTLSPVAKVSEPVESDISTTYFDTVDLRLAAQGITVRRTSTNEAVAWDLHVIGEGGTVTCTEAEPNDAGATVPGELTDLVRASLRDKALAPVAAIRTVRRERRLLDAEDRELARVADDVVHGQRFTTDGAELTHWREIEVEVADGNDELLATLGGALDEAGIAPVSRTRLQRALGHVDHPVIDLREHVGHGTVGEVVTAHLRDQVARLMDHDRAVRRGHPGAVQDVRVAIRRFRCDLATWRPFLAADRTEELRAELRWMSSLLGRLRDNEVLQVRLVDTVRALPADMVVGPVAQRIEAEVQARLDKSASRVASSFEGGRYFDLVDRLERFAVDPPLTDRASDPAGAALADRVAHAVARFDRAADALDAPGRDEVRAERLHDVRKAARRAGYAAEAVEPQIGRRARRLAARMAAVQDALGEHQDATIARQALREIGAVAHVAGESAFTYGVLHGIERDRSEAAEVAFGEARRQLGADEARRWATA